MLEQIALVWGALWTGKNPGQEIQLGADQKFKLDGLLQNLELKKLGYGFCSSAAPGSVTTASSSTAWVWRRHRLL